MSRPEETTALSQARADLLHLGVDAVMRDWVERRAAELRGKRVEQATNQILEDLTTRASLHDQAHRACQELPQGWWIQIHLEEGYGGVELYNPDGKKVEIPEDYDQLQDNLQNAIDIACGEQ